MFYLHLIHKSLATVECFSPIQDNELLIDEAKEIKSINFLIHDVDELLHAEMEDDEKIQYILFTWPIQDYMHNIFLSKKRTLKKLEKELKKESYFDQTILYGLNELGEENLEKSAIIEGCGKFVKDTVKFEKWLENIKSSNVFNENPGIMKQEESIIYTKSHLVKEVLKVLLKQKSLTYKINLLKIEIANISNKIEEKFTAEFYEIPDINTYIIDENKIKIQFCNFNKIYPKSIVIFTDKNIYNSTKAYYFNMYNKIEGIEKLMTEEKEIIRKNFYIQENERDLVLDILDIFNNEKPISVIANYSSQNSLFNNFNLRALKNIKNFSKKGKKWKDYMTIKRILENDARTVFSREDFLNKICDEVDKNSLPEFDRFFIENRFQYDNKTGLLDFCDDKCEEYYLEGKYIFEFLKETQKVETNIANNLDEITHFLVYGVDYFILEDKLIIKDIIKSGLIPKTVEIITKNKVYKYFNQNKQDLPKEEIASSSVKEIKQTTNLDTNKIPSIHSHSNTHNNIYIQVEAENQNIKNEEVGPILSATSHFSLWPLVLLFSFFFVLTGSSIFYFFNFL